MRMEHQNIMYIFNCKANQHSSGGACQLIIGFLGPEHCNQSSILSPTIYKGRIGWPLSMWVSTPSRTLS